MPDSERVDLPRPSRGTIDGHSLAPQIRGEKGTPREWVYVELNGRSYVRDARFKLTNGGALFDIKEAPFVEVPVPIDTTDAEAIEARKRLQAVLSEHPTAPGRAISRPRQQARPASNPTTRP